MARLKKQVCKICRRAGVKLLLKGERCLSSKCPFLRKPYPPGFGKAKRRTTGLSDYGRMLREKQKFKAWYFLTEKELKNLVKEVLKEKENPEETMIQILETRLESVVFRAGFARSRKEARQMISHRFFKVNEKVVNFPSFRLKVGDIVVLNEKKLNKKNIERIKKRFQEAVLPPWLKKEGEGVKLEKWPSLADCQLPANLEYVFEFYSK